MAGSFIVAGRIILAKKKRNRPVHTRAERIAELRRRHESLGDKIAELQLSPSSCNLRLTELKREKLRLKDKVARSSRQVDQMAAE
ncbi:MAG: YdcH family protein [Candidatus Paceibacteria bacterium]